LKQSGDNMPTLNWLTREEDLKISAAVPYRLLEEVPEHSYTEKDPATENMLIQGDNLEALKALLPFYAGKVKCIFIDPPYNTRSAFEHYDDNLEHAQWLGMMYPRLELLSDLLTNDGSIWVTIDDNESHYLKIIMDEVFGRKNFLTTFIWKKAYGGGAKSKWFVGLHEYVHCYAKNLASFDDMFLPPDPDAESKYYKLIDEKKETRGPFRVKPLEATKSMDRRENLVYPIPAPDGSEVWPKRQWWWAKERVYEAVRNNDLYFAKAKDGTWSIQYKQYLRDEDGNERLRKPTSIIDGPYTQDGTKETTSLFGNEGRFSFPKPEGLISSIIEGCSKQGDLVLDSFLGSGTTAAVAQKMGRQYIGIEMGDHAVTHCVPRLKKVVDGEQGGISESVGWKGGGGFRFYRLGSPVFDEEGRINPKIRFEHLAAHVWFSETRTPPLKKRRNPMLGVHEGTAYYLLYNGILGDKRPDGGNVLTRKVLAELGKHNGPRVIYGESSRIGPAGLKSLGIVFKQTPYDVRAR
jgi:adenine-specific DNA-methyltransferase